MLKRTGIVEQPRLAPVIGQGRRQRVGEKPADGPGRRREESPAGRLVGLGREAVVERVRRVGKLIRGNAHLTSAVPVIVVHWDARLVDGELLEIRTAIALRVFLVSVYLPVFEHSPMLVLLTLSWVSR